MNGDGNFKARCVSEVLTLCNKKFYTNNKIYEVINGEWKDDTGELMGGNDIKTIDDLNKHSVFKWELVEDEISEPVKNELSVSERMRKVAELLGLELNEEFNIIRADGSLLSRNPHKFTEHNLVDNGLMPVNGLIGALLTGRYKMKKLKWKPKNNEQVWTVTPNNECVWFVFDDKYPDYVACYKMGWIFKTSEEAEANKERVLREMKEVMDDE